MQTQVAAAKKYGHVRRPSYGKVTPISSLLLNLSNPSSIRHDGVSPDSSNQSHVFSFGPHGPILQHDHNPSENIVANVTNNFIEQEKFAEQNVKIEPESKPIEAIDVDKAFLKCVNYHNATTDEITNINTIVTRDIDDIDKYLPNGRDKPCLICNANSQQTTNNEFANDVNQPIMELCTALCNDECKMSTIEASNSAPEDIANDVTRHNRTMSRSNSSRQEFLASMLQEATTLVDAPKAVTVDATVEKVAEQTAPAVVVNNLNEAYFRDKLNVVEALAKTSMMTSPAAKRRLAARKMEMNLNNANFVYDSENSDYIPPKELLMYLVR